MQQSWEVKERFHQTLCLLLKFATSPVIWAAFMSSWRTGKGYCVCTGSAVSWWSIRHLSDIILDDVMMDLLCSNSPDNSRKAGQGPVRLQRVMKGYCHLTPLILLMLWRMGLVTVDNTSKGCSGWFLAWPFSLHECVTHSRAGPTAPSARGQCQVRNHTRAAYLSNKNAETKSREDGNSMLSGRTRAHLFSFSDFLWKRGLMVHLSLVGHESYHRDDRESKCL